MVYLLIILGRQFFAGTAIVHKDPKKVDSNSSSPWIAGVKVAPSVIVTGTVAVHSRILARAVVEALHNNARPEGV